MRKLIVLLFVLSTLLISACADDDPAALNQTPGQAAVGNGTIVVRFVLARAWLSRTVPANVTDIVFQGFDSQGALLFGPVTFPKATEITLTNVPTSVTTLQIDYLAGNVPVGQGTIPVTVSAGGTTVIQDPDFTDVTLTTLQVAPANQTLQVGGTLQFNATGIFSSGTSLDVTTLVTWNSSDAAVATVDAAGLATGLTTGTTTISASLNGATGSTGLTVQAAPGPVNANARLTGSFFGVGGTFGTRESNLRGTMVLNGDGQIAAGTSVTLAQHDVQPTGTLGAGTYTVDTTGALTLAISTPLGQVDVVNGRVADNGGAATADLAAGNISMDGGTTHGIFLMVQKASGLTNADLNGTYRLAGIQTSLRLSQEAYTANLVLDGAGNVTGTWDDPDLATFFAVANPIAVGAGSTYSVTATGDFTATLDLGLAPGPMQLNGAVGTDGTIVVTNIVNICCSGFGAAAQAASSASNADLNGNLNTFAMFATPIFAPIELPRDALGGIPTYDGAGNVNGQLTPVGGAAQNLTGTLGTDATGQLTANLTLGAKTLTMVPAQGTLHSSKQMASGRLTNGAESWAMFLLK